MYYSLFLACDMTPTANKRELNTSMLMPKQKHDNTPSKDVKSGLFLRYSHIPFLN